MSFREINLSKWNLQCRWWVAAWVFVCAAREAFSQYKEHAEATRNWQAYSIDWRFVCCHCLLAFLEPKLPFLRWHIIWSQLHFFWIREFIYTEFAMCHSTFRSARSGAHISVLNAHWKKWYFWSRFEWNAASWFNSTESIRWWWHFKIIAVQ